MITQGGNSNLPHFISPLKVLVTLGSQSTLNERCLNSSGRSVSNLFFLPCNLKSCESSFLSCATFLVMKKRWCSTSSMPQIPRSPRKEKLATSIPLKQTRCRLSMTTQRSTTFMLAKHASSTSRSNAVAHTMHSYERYII